MAFIKIRPGVVTKGAIGTADTFAVPADAETIYLDADHVRIVRPGPGGATEIHDAWSRNYHVKGSPAAVVAAITKARQAGHGGEPCECPAAPAEKPSNDPPAE